MLLETSIQKANLIMNLRSMGISSSKVLSAIEKIPRELFVPSNFHSYAYQNNPLQKTHFLQKLVRSRAAGGPLR